MSYYTELLNVESEDITILGDAYFGYSSSLIKKEDNKLSPYIASCFVVSGVLKTLLKPGSGSEAFNNASEYYRILKNNYWIVCSVCGNNIERFISQAKFENSQFENNINVFEEILISPFLGNTNRIYNEQINSSYPVGRLNIPIKLYIDALQSLNNQQNSQYISTDSIAIYLNRAAEYLLFLKEDSFHWQNLKGDFLYVEPETLAFCMTLCRKLRNNSIIPSSLIEKIKVDPLSKLPLLLANDILINAERY